LEGNLGTLFPENEKSALSAEVPVHPLKDGPRLIGSRDHHVGDVVSIRRKSKQEIFGAWVVILARSAWRNIQQDYAVSASDEIRSLPECSPKCAVQCGILWRLQ